MLRVSLLVLSLACSGEDAPNAEPNPEAGASREATDLDMEDQKQAERPTVHGQQYMGDESQHRKLAPAEDTLRSREPDILAAQTHLEEGRVSEAMALLKLATERRPDDPDAHYWLGRSQQEDGRFDLAAPSMLRAVEIDPDFASAWKGVATSFVLQRRCEDAMEALDRYVELKPDDAGGYYNRGGCRYQAGDREGSLEDGKKACEMGMPMACRVVEKQQRHQQVTDAMSREREAQKTAEGSTGGPE